MEELHKPTATHVLDETHQPLCPNNIIGGSDYHSCKLIVGHGYES